MVAKQSCFAIKNHIATNFFFQNWKRQLRNLVWMWIALWPILILLQS